MNLNFKKFQKTNLGLKKLNDLRSFSFKKFETLGFPTRRQENWKYTDLKNIISNNFSDLQIIENQKESKFNSKFLIKNFEHNRIVLLNGHFIEKNLSFEDQKKINIKSLNTALKSEKDFRAIVCI